MAGWLICSPTADEGFVWRGSLCFRRSKPQGKGKSRKPGAHLDCCCSLHLFRLDYFTLNNTCWLVVVLLLDKLMVDERRSAVLYVFSGRSRRRDRL